MRNDEISWSANTFNEVSCPRAKRKLSRVRKEGTYGAFSFRANGIRGALPLCMNKQFTTSEESQRPHYVADFGSTGQTGQTEATVDDVGLTAFLSARGRLLCIAKRILRNATEAEDVLQDVWIRWQSTDRSVVRDAVAFLATTTMRLAINVIQSARWRRETDVEPPSYEWVDPNINPESEMGRSEALQSASLVLLEKLSPAEQAAFVLREAFEYSYREIANILRMHEANARQLVTRARRNLSDRRRITVKPIEQYSFVAAFVAAHEGSLSVLEAFFLGKVHFDAEVEWKAAPVARAIAESHPNFHCMPTLDVVAA